MLGCLHPFLHQPKDGAYSRIVAGQTGEKLGAGARVPTLASWGILRSGAGVQKVQGSGSRNELFYDTRILCNFVSERGPSETCCMHSDALRGEADGKIVRYILGSKQESSSPSGARTEKKLHVQRKSHACVLCVRACV